MSIFREVKVSTLHKWRVKLTDVYSRIYPARDTMLNWKDADRDMQELIDDICRTIGDLEEQGFGRGGFGE
jgi:hypothetical protein